MRWATRCATSSTRPKVKEAAILSTCNRTEVYVHGTEPQPVVRWLEDFHRVPKDSLSPYIYTLPREQAVTHAFRVASGLDSMVLGEPQILGQMKQAVRHAESAGSLGLVLNRLFQRTFAVAKDVRTQTDIGSASISMAAAAVKLAERIFPALADQRLLFIGAGEMIDLTATHFAARNPRSITIANRTLERGRELAARFRAEAITLNEMPDRLHEFDIIVTCTASTLPILGKGLLERVVKARRHAPVFVVDLAVPRDVEPEAAELDDVFLYSIDDLSNIVQGNLQIRKEAVAQAEEMIADAGRQFPALARGAHGGADDHRAARASRSAARRRARARAPAAGGRHVAGAGAGAPRPRPHQQVPARADAGAEPGRRRRARGARRHVREDLPDPGRALAPVGATPGRTPRDPAFPACRSSRPASIRGARPGPESRPR